ncbi:MAG: hypothetical protein GC157_00160 [Frankiales bacterium]|nr:hypothetical protein [Frankiales bacterium]
MIRSARRALVLAGATGVLVASLVPAAAAVGGAGSSAVSVTGTVERYDIDDFSHPLPAGADSITYVRTADGPVQVPGDVLAHVPNGSVVTLGLRSTLGMRRTATGGLVSALPASAAHDPAAGASVASVSVLSAPAPGMVATGSGFVAPTTSTRATAAGTTTAAATTVTHSVLVVVAQPAGSAAPGVTSSTIAATVDNGVDAYWSTVTGGVVRFAATAYPGVVPTTNVPCTTGGNVGTSSAFWSEIATATHWTPGAAKHLLVYFPTFTACGGIAGLGSVGNGTGSGGMVWSNGFNHVGVLGHELGHNLGLGHSQELDCTVGGVRVTDAPAGSCSARSYWDTNDIMAVSWSHQGFLNASHLRRLGLLAGGGDLEPTTSGTATIAPLEGGTGLRALTLDDGATKYVVEFRQPTGQDAWMSSNPGWGSPGVTVRREFDLSQPGTSSFNAIESYVLDGDPATTDPSFGNLSVTMPTGVWIDLADQRVGIRVTSESAAGAVVDYRLGLPSTDPRYAPPPRPTVSTPVGHLTRGTAAVGRAGPAVPVRWAWSVTTPAADGVSPATVTNGYRVGKVRAPLVGWTSTPFRAAARASDGSLVSAVGHLKAHYAPEYRASVASYSRGWHSVRQSGALGGRVMVSTLRGQSAALHITGRSIGVLLARGPAYGAVAVYLDGHRVATLNLHGPRSTLQLAYTATFGTYSAHTVRVVNLTGGARGHLGIDGVVSQA